MLRHLPNAICLLRIALIGPLVHSLQARDFRLTLWVFIVAAVSDGADGYLAKRFGWTSEAGKLLAETVSARHSGLPMDVIDEAIRLNHALVHQPFAKTDLKVKLLENFARSLSIWVRRLTDEVRTLSE